VVKGSRTSVRGDGIKVNHADVEIEAFPRINRAEPAVGDGDHDQDDEEHQLTSPALWGDGVGVR